MRLTPRFDSAPERPDVGGRVVFVKQFEALSPFVREADALSRMPAGAAPELLATLPMDRCVVMAGVDGRHLDQSPTGWHAHWMAASLRAALACAGRPGTWEADSPTGLSALQESLVAELARFAPPVAGHIRDCLNSTDGVACHGDISPSNILITDGGHAVLLDFEFYGPGNLIADLAAAALTPSLSVPIETRMRLFTDSLVDAALLGCRTDPAHVAGSVGLWTVQCAAWHQGALDASSTDLAVAAIDLGRQAIAAIYKEAY